MFLVVGLGNPGSEYKNTRHNAGFMAADEIIRRYSFSKESKKFDGLLSDGKIDSEKTIILKPQTYMNLSGNSVHKASSFYKIHPNNIIVLHDDLDLEAGKIKIKLGGGAGGHNGLKSIDSHIGKEYIRIRIGIGRPKGEEKVVGHVLNKFSKAEMSVLEEMIDLIANNIDVLINKDIAAFSNKIGLERIKK